ncbi:MAG: hypothetical protein ACRCUY_08245 [Thermoguttaceae bacterium]
MKKFMLFCFAAVLVSSFAVGCTSSGSSTSSSNWCRLGSPWSSRSSHPQETVYMTGSNGYQTSLASSCNPCEPAACNPCEPVCNPCDMSCTGNVYSGGILPGPVN